MDDQLVPGDYTTLVDLKIRSQMDTQSMTNQVGVYTRGVPFTVYEVYPEKSGIVWGRVSSNTGSGTSRYVGLRVANQAKAKLEKAFEAESKSGDSGLANLAAAINHLADTIHEVANKQP